MQEDLKQTFQNLLQEELVLMGKFIEHLHLAQNTVDNDQVKVFLAHLLEEEEEHKQQVATLLDQIAQLPAAAGNPSPPPSAQAPAEPEAPSPREKPDFTDEQRRTGHFERRDQNILTVGSLYGVPQ